MSKLRDRLEEFKRIFESGDPPYNSTPEVVATMHRATAELKASGDRKRRTDARLHYHTQAASVLGRTFTKCTLMRTQVAVSNWHSACNEFELR